LYTFRANGRGWVRFPKERIASMGRELTQNDAQLLHIQLTQDDRSTPALL